MNVAQKHKSHAESVLRDSCPVRRSFVERAEGSTEPTPLSRLLRTQGDAGGKGGALRVSLLLSLIWLCAKEPYSTSRIAQYWAELLEADDPENEGARTIRDCLHELRDRGFIQLNARGTRVEIVLNAETSIPPKPLPYRPPYELEPYLPIPRAFWTHGLAGTLSGAGIAMYLVALAMTRYGQPAFFLSGEFFDDRFGISRSSRKRGLAELVKRGVLTVESVESVDFNTFKKVRRNVYTIADEFQQPAPKESPTTVPETTEEPEPVRARRSATAGRTEASSPRADGKK